MTRNNYTIIENTQKSIYKNCVFCSEIKEADYIIKTRKITNNRLLDYDGMCLNCRDKFNNSELEKCPKCERLLKPDKKICKCELLNDENTDEEDDKGDRETIQLEKQISELSTEKDQLKEDVEIAISALGVAEHWDSRQELIEENEQLGKKARRLSDENKELKKQVGELETQLLGVEETSKKARRLSNENRILKGKVEGLEVEIEKYKGEAIDIKPNISQLKTDILEIETKLEKMLLGVELEAKVEQPPK